MDVNRRTFLGTVGAAVTLVAFSDVRGLFAQSSDGSALFPIPPETYSEPLFSMTQAEFEAHLGQRFIAIAPDGRPTDLILSEVNSIEQMPNATRGSYGESFSLIFLSRSKRRLEQDVFELHADGLKRVSVLLVPTDRERRQYEVVVNHLTW